MASIAVAIRYATNLAELQNNIKQGINQVEALNSSVEKMADRLGGSKMIQSAHNLVAAIDKVGVSTLTAGQQASSLAQLERAMEKLDAAGKPIPEGMRRTADELKRVAEAANAAENAKKALQERITSMQGKLDSFASGARTVGLGLTAALTVPIMGAGIAAIKLGMDAVESENLVAVSFGGMAAAAKSWSAGLSQSLGLNRFESEKMAATLFNMTTSMGIARGAAFDMSTGVVQLAGDMASFRNIPMEEALAKIRSGLVGEAEPLKAIGILVNEATVKTYAYTHGIAKQGEALTEQQKVMARWGAILAQTSNDQGDLARTLESPANQLRIMKDRVTEAGTALGIALMPMVQQAIGLLSSLAPKVQAAVQWFANLPAPVKLAVVGFAGLLAALGPIVLVLGSIASAVSVLLPHMAVLSGAFAVLTGPIGLVVAAVVGLIAVWKIWGDDITRIVSGTFAAVKTWLWDKFEPVLTPVIALVKSVASAWKAAYDLQVAVMVRIVEAVASMVGSVRDWLVDKFGGIWRSVVAGVQFLRDGFVWMRDAVIGVVTAVYTGVKTWLVDKFTAVVNGVRQNVEKVTGVFRSLTSWLRGGDSPQVAVQSVVAGVTAAAPKIETAVAVTTRALATVPPVINQSSDAAKKYQNELRDLADQLTGRKLAAEVTKLADAVAAAGGSAKITAHQKEQLGKQLVDMARQGATLHPELHKIWLEYEKLHPSIKVVTAGQSGFLDVLKLVPSVALKVATGLKPLPGALNGSLQVDPLKALEWMKKLPGIVTKLAEPPAKSFAMKFQEVLMTDLPRAIMSAIQGGGDIIAAAGSVVGSFLMSDDGIGKTLSKHAKSLFGDKLGGFISSALPGLGAMIGPAISSLFGKIFGSAGRDSVEAFAKTMGGFDALREKLNSLDNGEQLWKNLTQGVGKNNPAQAQAAIEAITRALEEQQEFIEGLAPSWRETADLVEKYGGNIEELPAVFKQARLGDAANEIAVDWRKLTLGIGDAAAAMMLVKDKANEVVHEAMRLGLEVPDSMRPLLEQMAAAGQLTDHLGNTMTDVSKINFSTSLSKSVERIIEALDRLIAKLGGDVAAAVDRVPKVIDIQVGWKVGSIPGAGAAGEHTQSAHTGALVTAAGIRRFHQGTARVLPFPGLASDEVPAILQTGEAVLRRQAVDALGTDAVSALNAMGSGGSARAGTGGRGDVVDLRAVVAELKATRAEQSRRDSSLAQQIARAVRDETQKVVNR